MNVLITGGAGFIGSHLADALLDAGLTVRVLDNLDVQVHPERGPDLDEKYGAVIPWDVARERGELDGPKPPEYLSPEVEFLYGDVRDHMMLHRALEGIDVVYHFAAKVGVGQSMYEVGPYMSVNGYGTAVLLEALAAQPAKKLIVASSMSVYGEGSKHFGVRESPDTNVRSVYALTKDVQERLCLLVGEARGIPTTALRFFNVYGTRQALSNPYTGVIAIFASRLLNDKPPLIYEDGLQSRDFVSVHDIVQACMLALYSPEVGVFNVGTGLPTTVLDVAEALGNALGKNLRPTFTGKRRVGDIRHCFADISRAQRLLGYRPTVTLDQGLMELVGWLQGQPLPIDRVPDAALELETRGLAS